LPQQLGGRPVPFLRFPNLVSLQVKEKIIMIADFQPEFYNLTDLLLNKAEKNG